jgi:hypothetical protein
MARSVTTFDSGNRIGLKLTPELSSLFVNTIKITGRISVAAGRCDIGVHTARDWLRKGRLETADPIYREFATAVGKAHAEFLAVVAKRQAQLAIGGTIELPKFDKQNQIVRDKDGEIVWEERFFPPNPQALMHILDRIDPEPNGPAQLPGVPETSELNDAEAIAEAAKYFDLYREGVQILIDLGCPPRQLLESWKDIETTATKPPAEPEPAPPTETATPKKITVPEAF